MYVTITILNYPRYHFYAGFLSMIFFRIFLFGKRKSGFYKLMGTGLNGSFDLRPDLWQWVILSFSDQKAETLISTDIDSQLKKLYGNALRNWIKFFGCEIVIFRLETISGHGAWDGKNFQLTSSQAGNDSERIAVLTRATIRIKKLAAFWKAVPATNETSFKAKGLLFSIGIGEAPVIRQATFSIWNSAEDMKAFAYQTPEHLEVIKKTKAEAWYSEEMFLRMKLLAATGSVKGKSVSSLLPEA